MNSKLSTYIQDVRLAARIRGSVLRWAWQSGISCSYTPAKERTNGWIGADRSPDRFDFGTH